MDPNMRTATAMQMSDAKITGRTPNRTLAAPANAWLTEETREAAWSRPPYFSEFTR
jgi:hypothetical protein